MSLIDTGFWDDPHAYNSSYADCNDWGDRRWSTPGVVIDGVVSQASFGEAIDVDAGQQRRDGAERATRRNDGHAVAPMGMVGRGVSLPEPGGRARL